MKKNVFLALLSVLLLASCKLEYHTPAVIDPSETIVKNEYRMESFTEMDIDVVANVKFIQSDSNDYRVVLSCPDNYVELFKFEVEDDGELNIGFVRDNVNIHADHVDITVYAPQLRSLDNSGVASVEIDRLSGQRFKVENSGVGGIYIKGLQMFEVVADCSGVGSIELAGVTDRARFDCSGVGSIQAENLKAKSVNADVSGVGGIKCHASESIDAEVSGVGGLEYGGKPQDKKLRREGIGDITEL